MSRRVLILAQTGSGKSSSIENLDPSETFIVNVGDKSLPFPGWKKKYTLWEKLNPEVTKSKGNLYVPDNPNKIVSIMKHIAQYRPDIKNIVVDDLQYCSSFEFFNRIKEKGYDKFNDIGANLFNILLASKDLREDLTVVYMMHSTEIQDDRGVIKNQAMTIGKLVDDKLKVEGLFDIVLYAKVKRNQDNSLRFVFETQPDPNSTCKSPRGMFEPEIPNDLNLVINKIKEYENQ